MKNRSISLSVVLAFVSMVVILIVGARYALNTLDGLHQAALGIAHGQWENVQLATESLELSNQNSTLTMEMFLAKSEPEILALMARRQNNSDRITALLSILQTRSGSQLEQQKLDDVVEARRKFQESFQQATRLLLQKQHVDAESEFDKVTLPRSEIYLEAFQRYREFQSSEMNQQLGISSRHYSIERTQIIQLLVIALLIEALVAVLMTVKLSVAAKRSNEAEGALRKWNGELENLIRQRSGDLVSANRELKREIEARRREEARFRRILVNLPYVSWTSDQDGRMIYVSPNVEATVGFTPHEVYAGARRLLHEQIHPEDLGRVRESYRRLFDGVDVFDEEFRIRAKDGRWLWVHDRSIRTHEEGGARYADGVLRDITRRKTAETELQAKTALLEAQINSTIDGILVVDERGQRILHNDMLIEIFSIPHEIVADTDDRAMLAYVVDLIKDKDAFIAKVDYLYSHPEEKSSDEVELKDGTCLDRYSSPVTAKDGRYLGRIWNFRDITRRKRIESELRQFSRAVEQSPVSVVITDPEGRIIHVNRKFTACTGYEADEVLGRNPRILNSGYSPVSMYRHLWKTIKAGKEWRGEFRNKRKNGELYWEAATITPITDAKGAITHFLAMKEDITERRLMEAQLRQAQKLEGIGQLAAGIAHEINTPTQFVTDNLVFLQESWAAVARLLDQYRQTLKSVDSSLAIEAKIALQQSVEASDLEFIEAEVPRSINQSLEGAHRVADIVRAMREFSHPDSVEKVQINLNEAIKSTITVARNEWKYCADITTKLDDALPSVACHPGEINQVILNLIVNAAHSIGEKNKQSGRGTISISTRYVNGMAEVAIADTGTGIKEDIQTRIFEPFFTTKDVGKGTGQGLALAHNAVVKKHRGKIWFETEVGVGTTFFMQIPCDAEPSRKDDYVEATPVS